MPQKEFEFVKGMDKEFSQEELNEVVDYLHDKETNTLCAKGAEYATKGDRLENFRVIANLLGLTMEQVCCVFLLKHIFALIGYATHGRMPTTESIGEKGTDARNYIMFLLAILSSKGINIKEIVNENKDN